ncbi:DUF3472 domain-containing protein [Deminuibacter soli]|nr:RICIN domain-containing protein [Deminuibacter soli]
MKSTVLTCLLALTGMVLKAQSNAAPSEHLVFSFASDAVAKIHKVKIVQSAYTSYFAVHNYNGGYNGLQQTPDSSKGSSHTLIASLWDPNTSGGIYSSVFYAAPNTYTGRFGGEGDGWQSINPYNWTLNTWYNIAIRSWKSKGNMYVATFIQNLSTNQWFLTSILAEPSPAGYLGSGNDAFLENWDGSNAAWDGRFKRKAFFKDCWNLDAAGNWSKHTSRYFSANANDAGRNGIYDRAFNAGYDATEDAYFMEHGADVTPGAGFGTGRTLTLPVQTNQGTAPVLTTASVTGVSASYAPGKIIVNWTTDNTKSPQLAAKVEILSGSTVVQTYIDTVPQRRADTLTTSLAAGTYTARVTVEDIFNGMATPVTGTFSITSGTTWYKLKNVFSGKYLDVKNNSTANSATLVQNAASSNYSQQWSLSTGGVTTIVNRGSGKAIDLPGSAQDLGTHPIQYTLNGGGTNQQWHLVGAGSGAYLIQSNMSNHYILDDSASSTTNGTGIILYSYTGTGTANQQWTLETVSTLAAPLAIAASDMQAAPASQAGNMDIQVYPNPVTSTLHVQLGETKTAKYTQLVITDLSGHRMKVVNINNTGNIDVSRLQAGLYFITGNGVTKQFVKQ